MTRLVYRSVAVRAVLLGLGCLIAMHLACSIAYAGGPDAPAVPVGPIQTLFRAMRSSVMAWQRSGQDAARAFFVVVAGIDLAWSGIETMAAGSDVRGGILRLARQVLVLSIFYKLIDLGPDIADELVKFFERAGLAATGSKIETTQLVLDKTLEAMVKLLRASDPRMMGIDAVWVGLCALATVILIGITAAAIAIVEFASFVVFGVGAIVLGAGGCIWTRFLVQNYFKCAAAAGGALYFLRFTQSFVLAHLEAWATTTINSIPNSGSVAAGLWGVVTNGVSSGPSPETMLTMLSSLVIQALLVIVTPTLAAFMFGDSVAKVAESVGRVATNVMQRSGAGSGIQSFAGAARTAGRTAQASLGRTFLGSGNGGSLLNARGGAKPDEAGRSAVSGSRGSAGRGAGDERGTRGTSERGAPGTTQQGGTAAGASVGAGGGEGGGAADLAERGARSTGAGDDSRAAGSDGASQGAPGARAGSGWRPAGRTEEGSRREEGGPRGTRTTEEKAGRSEGAGGRTASAGTPSGGQGPASWIASGASGGRAQASLSPRDGAAGGGGRDGSAGAAGPAGLDKAHESRGFSERGAHASDSASQSPRPSRPTASSSSSSSASRGETPRAAAPMGPAHTAGPTPTRAGTSGEIGGNVRSTTTGTPATSGEVVQPTVQGSPATGGGPRAVGQRANVLRGVVADRKRERTGLSARSAEERHRDE